MPSYISRPIIIFGVLLLFHACYSAYEHSKFIERLPGTSYLRSGPSAAPTAVSLPFDISLETVVSVLLVCAGLVLGADELQPISWRVWAGKAERESRGGGPFQVLEERVGFVDIRAKRKEFADWVRGKGEGELK